AIDAHAIALPRAVGDAVEPRLDLDDEDVLPLAELAGHVQGAGVEGVGMSPDLGAVQIDDGGQVERLEGEIGALAGGERRGVKGAAVVPDGLLDPARGQVVEADG